MTSWWQCRYGDRSEWVGGLRRVAVSSGRDLRQPLNVSTTQRAQIGKVPAAHRDGSATEDIVIL